MKQVRTTCPYCGVGCGIIAKMQNGSVSVEGDPNHPANFGRLCSKGSALAETISLEGRALSPQVDGQETSWDNAIELVANKFKDAIEKHGPDSVAFYVSGQLLTEDYYVANKLMKGFIGSGNIDTNSRLCMASSVAGHKRAFGADIVPCTYEDLEKADTVVLVGSNLAWCHPVIFQRLRAAKEARPEMKIVVIDPRETATCEIADLHLAIGARGDVALFNQLLAQIHERDKIDHAYVGAHVDGLKEAVQSAKKCKGETGLSASELSEFNDLWLKSEKTVTVYSQGVNQSVDGTDKVNAIINCHLATGRIGREGMGPFSVTGQPNAMGGREVGGLANMLACHMDIENEAHHEAVRQFWNAPNLTKTQGLKAVDMFDAVERGDIKALWIISTNPAVSMPEADRVKQAIAGCDFVVVSDILPDTDTAKLADVVLPATAWGEKEGSVTNSERMMSKQNPFMPAPGDARPDWKILADVGVAMGWAKAFSYENVSDVFKEYVGLSKLAGEAGRAFDVHELADISDIEYKDFEPRRWPISRKDARFFADGKFYTTNQKAKMLPLVNVPQKAKKGFELNTGRIRDQWHTMTRTGRTQRLTSHIGEPFVEIHPADAMELGIQSESLVSLHNPHGDVLLRALVSERGQRGKLFSPIHWTDHFASNGRIDKLVTSEVDPISGQPNAKGAYCDIAPAQMTWHGFALSCNKPNLQTDYWAISPTQFGWRMELASKKTPSSWEDFIEETSGVSSKNLLSMQDQNGNYRAVAEGEFAIFISPDPVVLSREFLVSKFTEISPMQILAGGPNIDQPDPGPIVCSCFQVGRNQILSAIDQDQLQSVDAVGDKTCAGTNCGSCRSEIKALLQNNMKEAAQ